MLDAPISLLLLGGTLFAGLVAGAGAATMLWGRLSLSRVAAPAASPGPAASARRTFEAAPSHVANAPNFASPNFAATPEPVAVAKLALAAVLSEHPQAPDHSLERWISDIGEGPRFRPYLVGLVSPDGFAKADALARLAEAALAMDRDVGIVDAGGTEDGALAAALDRRMGDATRAADPFGAGARVEIVPPADLLPAGDAPDAKAWSAALQGLAARTDVVLVDLPNLATLARLASLPAALDQIVLLHGAGARDGEALMRTARRLGVTLHAQVLVAD